MRTFPIKRSEPLTLWQKGGIYIKIDRRILTLIICIFSILLSFSTKVDAAIYDRECGDNLTWNLVSGTLTISGKGAMYDYRNDYDKNRPPWYPNRHNIFHVEIEEGVTSIGNYAFVYVDLMNGISLPDSLKSIGTNAFSNTSIQVVTIPNGVVTISQEAFSGCKKLSDVAIPASVTTIGYSAFYGCINPLDVYYGGTQEQWKSITIGSNNNPVTNASIVYSANATYAPSGYSAEFCGRGVTWHRSNNNTLEISGTGKIWNYEDDNDIALPWRSFRDSITKIIIGEGITRVGDYAFSSFSNLKDIQLSAGMEIIGWYSFSGCENLHIISIPNGVITIGRGAFGGCTRLYDVAIPSSLTYIGENAFSVQSWTEYISHVVNVYYGGSLEEWETRNFSSNTGLGNACLNDSADIAYVPWVDGQTMGYGLQYTLENGVLTISGVGSMWEWDFSDIFSEIPWYEKRNSITSLIVENGVKSIGDFSFYECKLEKAEIANSVKQIGRYAFYHCSLTDIVFPPDIEVIEERAFEGNNFRMLTFPQKLSSIGASAFNDCEYLCDLALPKSLESIGNNAFEHIQYIYYSGTEANWKDVQVENGNSYGTVIYQASSEYVPYIAGETCGRGLTWSISGGVLTITGTGGMWSWKNPEPDKDDNSLSDLYAQNTPPWFGRRLGFRTVIINEGVTSIGSYSFYNCANLKGLTLPVTLEVINSYAFSGCSALMEVNYSGTIEQVSSIEIERNNGELYAVEWNYKEDKAYSPFISSIRQDANTVTANLACDDMNAIIFCVAYNNSGKMIAVRSAQVTGESSYQFQFDGQQFDYAKAFIVDGNFRPLCESKKS